MNNPIDNKFNQASDRKGPFVEGMDNKPREATRTVPHDKGGPAPPGGITQSKRDTLWAENKALAESLRNDTQKRKSEQALQNSAFKKGELTNEYNVNPASLGTSSQTNKEKLRDQNKVLAESLQNDLKKSNSGQKLDNSMSNKGELKREFKGRSI